VPSKDTCLDVETVAQTAVVLQFLSVRPPGTAAELYARIRERQVGPADIDAALEVLVRSGVIVRQDSGALVPGGALGKLDSLRLICV
jgi:hypothetical protein